jgi:hypothetical protein
MHPRVTTRCEVVPETAHGQAARNARPVREGRSRDQPRRPGDADHEDPQRSGARPGEPDQFTGLDEGM